jgi:hypothetical protein
MGEVVQIPMLRTLLVVASLATFAFAATVQAAPGLTCQAKVTIWSEALHCGTTATALDSSESWCPSGSHCAYRTLVECTGQVLFPCTILP